MYDLAKELEIMLNQQTDAYLLKNPIQDQLVLRNCIDF